MKKSVVKKIKKSCKGVISIFLCLVVTPFVSIACGLVEVYRYQSAFQTYRDIVDTTQFSSLSQYDEYLKKRFGLFAMSQQDQDDVLGKFEENLNKNLDIMGNAITTGDVTATGINSLIDGEDYEVLKSQIKDNSEVGVPVKMLKDVVDSSGIVDRFKNMFSKDTKEKFKNIKKGVDLADTMATLLQDVADLADKVKKIEDRFDSKEFRDKTDDFVNLNNQFLNQLRDDKFDYHTNNTTDANSKVEEILNNDDYFKKIKDIYDSAKKLTGSEGVYTKTKDILTSLSKIADDFMTLQTKIEALDKKDPNQKIGFEDVIESVNKELIKACTKFDKNTIAAYVTYFGTFELEMNKFTKLTNDNANSYSELTEVSDQNKMKLFVSNLMTIYYNDWNNDSLSKNERDTKLNSDIRKLYNLDTGLEVIDFLADQNTIIASLNTSLSDFVKNSSKSIDGFLNSIINTVDSLFKMKTLFDENLNSRLSEECVKQLADSGDSPFQTLLVGIQELREGIEKVGKSIGSVSIIDFFSGCKKALDGAVKVIDSIVGQFTERIDKMIDFVNQLTDPSKIYDELLIDGYITNNLPNRTNAGSFEVTSYPYIGTRVKLNGKSLTGFNYNDIITQSVPEAITIDDYDTLFSSLTNIAYGTDTMFKGAETEYILVGTSNEVFNQMQSFFEVFMLRLLSNIGPVLDDGTIETLAASVTPFGFVVYLLFLLAESYIDTILLVNGSDVPLIKLSCYLSPSGIPKLLDKIANTAFKNAQMKELFKQEVKDIQNSDRSLSSGDSSNSDSSNKVDLSKDNNSQNKNGTFKEGYINMKYDSYMLILLKVIVPVKDKLGRLANIIQLESDSYYRYKAIEKDVSQTDIIPDNTKTTTKDDDKNKVKGVGEYFKISKAYTTISTSSTVTFNPFISILEISNQNIFTKIYSQDLSY